MYNLLVVDDEPLILESLEYMLKKECGKHFIIYKASSAISALDIYEKVRIDLLMTDIRMPEMNGFELMEIVEKRWPDCVTIFLTGQNEFEYAKRAVNTNALEFVLKMDGDEAILAAIEKGYKQLELQYEKKSQLLRLKNQLKETMPLLKCETMRELVLGDNFDEDFKIKLYDKIHMINPKIDCNGKFLMAIVLTKSTNSILKCNEILDTIENVINPAFNTICTYVLADTGIILAQNNDNKPLHIKGLLEIALNICNKSGLDEPQIFLYNGTFNLYEAADIFYRLQMNYVGNEESEGVQLCNFKEKCQESIGETKKYALSIMDMEKISESLVHADEQTYYNTSAAIRKNINRGIYSVEASIFTTYASLLMQAILNYLPCDNNICRHIDFKLMVNYDLHKGFYEAMRFLDKVAEEYFKERQRVKMDNKSQIVHKINRYILEHLNEDLSVVKLGELVGFHPVYLSRIYKEITNMSITKYIYSQRINEAKRLLSDPTLSIQTIAEKTGLNSASYFTHFIKKHTGMTPQELRNTLVSYN